MDDATNRAAEAAACALDPDERDGRWAQWRALMAEALDQRVEDDRIVSRYPDRPDLRERLSALIAAEAECCSFLAFEVTETRGALEVELRFPPSFAPTLAGLGLSRVAPGR